MLTQDNLENKVGFIGMNFGSNVPVEAASIVLAGQDMKGFTILVVDEFQRFNGIPEEKMKNGRTRTINALNALMQMYGLEHNIILCSDFMSTTGYKNTLREIETLAQEEDMCQRLLATVPDKFRESSNAINYPLNELACVQFLKQNYGIDLKLGPSTEKAYDRIMQDLKMDIQFSYLTDTYALGTKQPESVIHYIPGHKGNGNGQRLYLDDCLTKNQQKLSLGPEEASRYMLKLGSASGKALGKKHLSEEEINALYGKKLKKLSKEMLIDNLLKPYSG